MTGSVQTKKGRPNYFAVLNIYDDNGKRKLKWVDTGIPTKGNNKRKADEKLNELIRRHENSTIDLSSDIYFLDFMKQWLETVNLTLEPTTYDGYKRIFDNHISPHFKPKRLRIIDVTPAHIQQYINAKLEDVSANTVRKHMANITKCFENAVKQNLITFNPAKRIELPKKVKYTGAKFYNEKQIEQLINCCKGDPLEIVIKLTLIYGLRRSEVLGLKWGAIDLGEQVLSIVHTVVKTGRVVHKRNQTKNDSSSTTFPIPEVMVEELQKWKVQQEAHKLLQPNDYVDEGYVCTYPDGRLLATEFVSHHFALLLKKNGMPHIRFHDLRHSSASYLKYLGFDLKDIQTWLRHGDIQTTLNLYTHLDMEAKKNIADKLNAKYRSFETPE